MPAARTKWVRRGGYAVALLLKAALTAIEDVRTIGRTDGGDGMTATARLEVRVRPDSKARLEYAAELANVPLSDFVRDAAEDRADRVLQEHESRTRVPAAFFDDLLAALDAPAQPNIALKDAATLARDVVKRA